MSKRYGATNDEVLQYAIDATKRGEIVKAGRALKNYLKLKEQEMKPCCRRVCCNEC